MSKNIHTFTQGKDHIEAIFRSFFFATHKSVTPADGETHVFKLPISTHEGKAGGDKHTDVLMMTTTIVSPNDSKKRSLLVIPSVCFQSRVTL